ncbi:hypothetical protein BROUX41_002115 [Berkeleyomyces rouxiae]
MSRSSQRLSLSPSWKSESHLRAHTRHNSRKRPLHNPPDSQNLQTETGAHASPAPAEITPIADLKKRDATDSSNNQNVKQIIQTVHLVHYVEEDGSPIQVATVTQADVTQIVNSASGLTVQVGNPTTWSAPLLSSTPGGVALDYSAPSTTSLESDAAMAGSQSTPLSDLIASQTFESSTQPTDDADLNPYVSLDATPVSSISTSTSISDPNSASSATDAVPNGVAYPTGYISSMYGTAGTASPPYPTGTGSLAGFYNSTSDSNSFASTQHNSYSQYASGAKSSVSTDSLYSSGAFSTRTWSSGRTSGTASTRSRSTWATDSTATASSDDYVGGIYGALDSTATAAPGTTATSDSTNDDNDNDGGGSSTTNSVVGGVVGGIAGAALIVFLVMMALKRWKKTHGGEIRLLDGTTGRGLLTGLTGGASAGATRDAKSPTEASTPGTSRAMLENPSPMPGVLASLPGLKAIKAAPSPELNTPPPAAADSERGFYRVSGRKLPSVLEHGGDGYTDPRASVMSTETVNYRDSTFDPLSPNTRFALGSPMRPVSGIPVMRDSPAHSASFETSYADLPLVTPPDSPVLPRENNFAAVSPVATPSSVNPVHASLVQLPQVVTVGRSLTLVHPDVQRHSAVGHFSEDV